MLRCCCGASDKDEHRDRSQRVAAVMQAVYSGSYQDGAAAWILQQLQQAAACTLIFVCIMLTTQAVVSSSDSRSVLTLIEDLSVHKLRTLRT